MGGTDHVTLVTHDDLVTSQVGSLGPVDNTTIEYRAVRLGQARGSGWTALTKMHHTTQEVSSPQGKLGQSLILYKPCRN